MRLHLGPNLQKHLLASLLALALLPRPSFSGSCDDELNGKHHHSSDPKPLSSRRRHHADPLSFKRLAEPLPIGEHSLAKRYDDLLPELEKVSAEFPHYRNFLADFFSKKNRDATVKEVADYVFAQKKKMVNALRLFKEKCMKDGRPEIAAYLLGAIVNLEVSARTMEKFETRAHTYRDQFRAAFSLDHPEHRDLVASIISKNQGEIGELEQVFKLNHVIGRGLHFGGSDPFSQDMSELVQTTFAKQQSELAETPRYFKQLKQRYPIMFSKIRDKSAPPALMLEQLEHWVRSKEIDVVTESPTTGVRTWTEIKNLGSPMDLQALTDKSEGKSYLEQLTETMELRDFLGLKGRVDIAVVYKSGLTQAVKDHLANLGIEAMGTIVDR